MNRRFLRRLGLACAGLVALLVAWGLTGLPGLFDVAPALAAEAAAEAGEHSARHLHHSKFAAFVFWMFALMVVSGAIFVITRKNLIAAVMGMVGTFFAIAAVYVMLFAHFMAAIQVLVYAGAIMVLFVFVIMILNRPEDDPWAHQATAGKVLTVLASLYLMVRIGSVLWSVEPPQPEAGAVPAPVEIMQEYRTADGEVVPAQSAQFGSSKAIGGTLFRDYLFPFEAVSLVLLIAVVGAIAVARPHKDQEDREAAEAAQAGGSA